MADPHRPKQSQTRDEMLAIVKMMNAALGGAIVKVDKILMH